MQARPARVLHVVGGMDRGGVETLLMNVYRRIDRTQLQFDFAVHTDRTCDYDAEILELGGRIFPHPNPSEAGFAAYGRSLWQTIKTHGRFKAVHSHVHHFSGLVLFVASRAGVAIRIAHSHTTQDGHSSSLPRITYRWLMGRLIHRYATHLLANSQTTWKALYGDRDDPRRRVVRQGLDLADYPMSPAAATESRLALSLPTETVLVGHVGGFRSVKNHFFLLNFFSAFTKRIPESRLILVGDGPLRKAIEKRIADLRLEAKVILLGSRADVPLILTSLDVLVLPSLYEGLPQVLIEAQAAGLPCLVSMSVTEEADLGLNLLHFMSLQDRVDSWVNRALTLIHRSRPDWNRRHAAIERHEHTIQRTLASLAPIYNAAGYTPLSYPL